MFQNKVHNWKGMRGGITTYTYISTDMVGLIFCASFNIAYMQL